MNTSYMQVTCDSLAFDLHIHFCRALFSPLVFVLFSSRPFALSFSISFDLRSLFVHICFPRLALVLLLVAASTFAKLSRVSGSLYSKFPSLGVRAALLCLRPSLAPHAPVTL